MKVLRSKIRGCGGEEGALWKVTCLRGRGGREREGVRGRWRFADLSMWLNVGHILLFVLISGWRFREILGLS